MSAQTAVPLGRLVMTPGVSEMVAADPGLQARMLAWLPRHARGECPHMTEHDQAANAEAVDDGSRIFTAWPTGLTGEAATIWLVTEADRSFTTYLLPSEY